MQDPGYPNIDGICRLCLKEDAGTISIFPDPQVKLEKPGCNMSIPMRIMSCAALEVQSHDGLPSKICSECRYQLEKSYLFRKQSQSSDTKLRKHIRLLSLGKKSKVFIKNPDDDDDDDDIEFLDSIDFIKEHDETVKAEEQLKYERFKEEIKSQQEIEMKRSKELMKTACREELRPELEQLVRAELRDEMQKELDEVMLPKVREKCLKEAKESLREEMREECRKSEMKTLLKDLQTFLQEKQLSRDDVDVVANDTIVAKPIIITKPRNSIDMDEAEPVNKKPRYSVNINKIQLIQLDDKTKNAATIKNQANKPDVRTTIIKPELILSDSPAEMDAQATTNDDDDDDVDGDSDNFLIYDTDEGFELQKKSEVSNENGGDDEATYNQESGTQSYDSESEENMITTHEESPKITTTTTTTSYRIEDGEIKFLNKTNDVTLSHPETIEGDNIDQLQNQNIMILNFPNELEDEDHLELVEYGEDFENKTIKPVVLKGQPLKRYRSSELNNVSLNNTQQQQQQQYTTTTSTIETTTTTLLAKTYVNTVQRPTDTPKIFKCNDCPMVFSTNSSLERHLRTHRKIEATGSKFECPECHVVVSCASALRRHMFIHCEEKPFICTECGKSFVQREILKRHMQTHTGIKPHQCEHCNRSFAQRINLKEHINRHHTDEPRLQQHSCHLCPKRFNHASGLSRHLASHSGVAFQCSECERTFGDRSSIKRHIANKHGAGKVSKSEKN